MADPPAVALIGREIERGEIRARLGLATDGVGGLVLVEGDAGIGKTSLAQQVTIEARGDGFDTAWAGCWQSASARPMLLWTQVLDQLAADGVDVPELVVEGSDPDQARLEQALRVERWLRRRAIRPLLIVLEDLHWADAATLSVLVHLASVLPGLPVLVVATHRPPVGAPATFRVAVDGLRHLGTRVHLGGLDEEATARLVSVVTGQPTHPRAADTITRITAGNPLFARELARTIPADRLRQGTVDPASVSIPDTLQQVVVERVSATSGPCQAMLEVLSALGDEAPVDLVADISDSGVGVALGVIDEATAAGLVVGDGEAVAFRHAIFRAAVYESLPSAARARLHDRIGNTLERRRHQGLEVDVSALAHHYVAASSLGDGGRAFNAAMDAAAEAEAIVAYDTAAHRYRDALAMLALDPAAGERSAVMLRLADAEVACGEVDEARATFRRVADAAVDAPETLARAALGYSGGIGGFGVVVGDPEVCGLLQRAVDALDHDDVLGSRVQARLSVASTYVASVPEREAMVQRARQRAERSGDASTITEVLAAWCDVMAGPAHVAERRATATEIIELASSVNDLAAVALGRRLLVEALAESGELAELAREIERFAEAASNLGRAEYRWYPPLWRGALAMARGEPAAWLRARRDLEELVDAGGPNASLLAKVQLCSMAFDLADVALGQRFYEEIVSPRLVMDDTQTLVTSTLLAAHRGAVDEARTALDRCIDDALRLEPDSEWPAMMLQLAELVELVGGHPRVDEVMAAVAPHASVWAVEGIVAGIRAPLSRAMGLLAAAAGRRAEAAAHFDDAHTAASAAGAGLVAALVDHDAGRLLDDPERQRRAAQTWQGLGATQRLAQLGDDVASGDVVLAPDRTGVDGRMVGNGEVWTLTFGGEEVTLADRKGLRDLARLLAVPGREISALDLMSPGGTVVERPLGDALDEQAAAAYKSRLSAIEDELDEADRHGDAARSSRLIEEQAALVSQLSGAFGLGGRPRSTGASSERARTAVRSRIRDALRRIDEVHPDLARHLSRAVQTGMYCIYDPDPPCSWDVTEPPHTV